MAREAKLQNDQIDIEGVRQLLELMEKHDVRELKVQSGSSRYVLRRGAEQAISYAPLPPQAVAAPVAAPATPAASGTATPAAGAEENLTPITSPTVGTFYPAPAPGEPPFVKVGDTIKAETVVCIVEAMKVFNQIPAGVSGTIARILMNEGDAVEFGQPMFLVKP